MPPPPFPLSPLGAWRRAREPDYFVREMSILHGGIGLSWPNDLEFSADGLRPDAIPAEAMLAEDRPFDKNTPGESAGLSPHIALAIREGVWRRSCRRGS
jgi:hypothetical protein